MSRDGGRQGPGRSPKHPPLMTAKEGKENTEPPDQSPAAAPSPADTYIDGRLSVEHQLDIHVNDLLSAELGRGPTVLDILTGIRYVMDYRIRNGRLPHLDYDLCWRLAQGLLKFAPQRQHHTSWFHSKRLAKEAEMAFDLFRDFLQEVYEFREAVGEFPLDELRRRLAFYPRVMHPLGREPFEGAITLLRTINRTYPQFDEWTDFFKEEDYHDVEKVLMGSAYFEDEEAPRKASIKPIICYPPQSLYFDRDVSRVCDMFKTSLETGLAIDQVEVHRREYGINRLPAPVQKSSWRMLWDQICDFMIIVLICTMILSAVMDFPKVTSAVVLATVIVCNVFIGFWQEWKAAKTVKAMKSLSVPRARVIREGHEDWLDASELVPGDVVILAEGDFVPADLRLAKVSRLEIVEANLTGESEAVPKNTLPIRVKSRKIPVAKCESNAFMSTLVARGSGLGIVVRVGEATELGKINAALAEQASLPSAEAKSPLQRKLSRLGLILVILAVSLSVVVVLAGIAWGKSFLEMLPVAISLAVSVIPEGLVAVVTVSMAIGMSRLAKEKAIVRKMPAVETLGAVTTICSDKTGTLTEGRMRVRTIEPSSQIIKGSGSEAGPVGQSYCLAVATLCNNANLTVHSDGSSEYAGDTTEIALLEAAFEASEVYQPVPSAYRLIEIPFDSDRKMMTVVIQTNAVNYLREIHPEKQPLAWALVKGAPEVLFSRCRYYAGSTLGDFREIDEAFSQVTSEHVDRMSDAGLRVLTLAMKPIYEPEMLERIGRYESDPESEVEQLYRQIESDLILVGIIGLLDPPRQDVSKSIQECFKAGINVCMITGDHLRTAISIARELGIYSEADPNRCRAMRGDDLDVLSAEAIAQMNPFPVVFARVSPANKLSIVDALQSRQEIVIMTGDGVNDAPAISKADVGIAMGQSGTEISKDAADVILLDDNFYTIMRAVHGGRLIYANILKFLVYLLACNSAEIWTVLLAALADLPVPLAPINILWANIIADVPPSMSLGMEPAESDLLLHPPRNVRKGVLSAGNWLLILFEGFLLSGTTLTIYIWELWGWKRRDLGVMPPTVLLEMRSEAFFILTSLQLILALFSRSTQASVFQTGLLGNRYLLGAVALSFGLLLMGHYTPGLNGILELRPIRLVTWARFAVSVLVLLVGTELLKLALRLRFGHHSSANYNRTNSRA